MKMMLLYIESNYPVNEWRIGEVDVWPLIRQDIGMKVLRNTIEAGAEPLKQIDDNEKIMGGEELEKLNENLDVVFFYDNASKVLFNNKWISKLTDPIFLKLQSLNYKVANLEFSSHGLLRNPCTTDYYWIQEDLNNVKTPWYLEKNYLPRFDEIKKKIDNILAKKNRYMMNKSQIYEVALRVQQKATYLYKIFKNMNVKVAFVVNYYSIEGAACILAANKASIISVDIEHGNQASFFYHNWNNVKVNGYNTLPNIFWNWKEEGAFKINEWANNTNNHRAIVGGNNWSMMWLDNDNHMIKVELQNLKEILSLGKKNILITLQPKYGLDGWNNNIPNELIQVIAESPMECKFYIRYHPSMLGSYHREMKECEELLREFIKVGKVETEISTKYTLPAILHYMDVHITAFSTCVEEAYNFGVYSITLHDRAIEFFKEYIHNGVIIQAKTSQEIKDGINKQFIKKGGSKTKRNINIELIFLEIINKHRNLLSYKEYNVNQLSMENEDFDVLDKVNHFIKVGYTEELKIMKSKLVNILNKDNLIRNSVLINLYRNNNFKTIEFLIDNIEPFTDLYFILGRIYSSSNNYLLTIKNLEAFIEEYYLDDEIYFNAINYLMSAHLYLGEAYYNLNEIENAKINFEKCVELSGYRHYKAEEYLEKINKY
ncbi:hypothetical protein HL291_16130 [Lysinibacillus fusiformis]|nr:hypothetical protein [Lysinibacillus fusiformis]